MEVSLNEKLYQAVCRSDIISIRNLLAKGACPNITSSAGKTSLGLAAFLGDIEVLQALLEGDYTSQKSTNTIKWSKSSNTNMPQGIVHQSVPYVYTNIGLDCEGFQGYQNVLQAQSFMYPFSMEYSQQNQGYYVFIHDEASPVELSPEWVSGGEGLEWDEEVGGGETLPTSEDDTWAALYKWYAQMLEQTEGLLPAPEESAVRSVSSIRRTYDTPDACQRTAAHYAAEQGHSGAINLLIRAGCKVDSVDGMGFTPMHLAASRGHLATVRSLINGGADPGRRALPFHPSTPLHIAAAGGHVNIIELLISSGAPLEIRDSEERTALQVASEYAQVDAVKRLVQLGANINVEDLNGSTPLCEAVRQGQVELVKVLLEFGAGPPPHQHLLHYAVLHRQIEVSRILIEAGAWVDMRDDNGDTPLLLAARSGQAQLAELLLSKGASVDYPNSLTGSTPLHEAVECIAEYSIFEELFVRLQDYNVNLNATSLMIRDTPLFRAILLQRNKVAILLIKHGADVNLCSLQGCVVDNLSLALKHGSMDVAHMLVRAGAPPPPQWGRTPLPLTHLARIALRKSLQPAPLFKSVQKLPLPRTLKGFIMLEDED